MKIRRRIGTGIRLSSVGWLVALWGIGLYADEGLGAASSAPAAAENLLRLAPSDAAAVLSVEGLRDHYTELSNSKLVQGLLRLPTIKSWLDSDRFRQLVAAQFQIEAFLHTTLAEIRDDLLGDAVVLSLQLSNGPAGDEEARGLLLLKARNRDLLDRLVRLVNEAQLASGELDRLGDGAWKGVSYRIRIYPAPSGRVSEYFVYFDDGSFAMSNAESLIRDVIDRKARIATEVNGRAEDRQPAGLGESERFRSVSSRLPGPAQSLARLFVDPRLIERLMAATPRPTDPVALRASTQLEQVLAAIDYAGASLSWKNRVLSLEVVESIDPGRLAPWLTHWARDDRPLDANSLQVVPRSVLAVGMAHADSSPCENWSGC